MPILVLLLIPLVASAASLLLRNLRRMEAAYLVSAAGAFAAAVWLAAQVLAKGVVEWAGGFF